MKRIWDNVVSGLALILLAIYFLVCAVLLIVLPFIDWNRAFGKAFNR